jgi:cation diffusion facilitator CzcD-associated flavoprotein CzcO
MDNPSTLSTSPEVAASSITLKAQVVVIGAGQAGLSAAYHLKKRGLTPHKGFVVLDQSPEPGGAWQYRWPSLTLSTVNRIHDLPGMPFSEALGTDRTEVRASIAVPEYFATYERRFELPVYRPMTVKVVCNRDDLFRVETDRIQVSARGLINATGTWESPYVPDVPGADRFKGRQLHTKDYRTPEEFTGRHVIVVGAGISAIQLLDEVSRVTTTSWVTRRPPEFRRPHSTRRPAALPWRSWRTGCAAACRPRPSSRSPGSPSRRPLRRCGRVGC